MPYSMSLISDIDEYYIPGHLYNFTIDVSGSGIDKFGFQTCFENEEGQKVGEIIIADSIQTQLILAEIISLIPLMALMAWVLSHGVFIGGLR